MFKLFSPPGVPRGAYPERAEPRGRWLDRVYDSCERLVFRHAKAKRRRLRRFVNLVELHGQALGGRSHGELLAEAGDVRHRLREKSPSDDVIARSFALVREVSTRVIGQRHFDVQLIGGWVLLYGMVAEMETGEGKTLTATLPASTAALAGVPVHIITVNDYLAKRDAAWMGPIYNALGLTVGVIVHGMDSEKKRKAYACDVVYCTNKEITFDYLRDRITLGSQPSQSHLRVEALSGVGSTSRASRLLLRGLHFAILDEADSVLVDEARTPLIISESRASPQERQAYETALKLAGKLKRGRHFKVDRQDRRIEFTGAGHGRLEEFGRSLGGVWTRRQLRNEMVLQALSAQQLFLRDQHYLIKDDKVQIIDEYTGRAMPDRSWEHGLHQAIEANEKLPLTRQNQPVARISYQRFFRRYINLAWMTGTAREVSRELGAVYGLAVVCVPTNRPLRRKGRTDRVYRTNAGKWKAIIERIHSVHRTGRPVLVGTRSVEASEHLSSLLAAAGLPHRVLNARQDEEEADVVATAGDRSRITVATNMAGRGTDIRLVDGVAELGGLHVIATERHDARRIDRQLFGRCGRQGDPGSYEAIVSLEDELIASCPAKWGRLFFFKKGRASTPLSPWSGRFLLRRAQRVAERQHWHARCDVLRMEESLEKTLAFSGAPE